MIAKVPVLGFAVEDRGQTTATLRFHVRPGTTVSAGMNAGDSMRTTLDPLTSASFTRQSVVYPFVDITPTGVIEGAEATRVGVFIFETLIPRSYAIIEIAGIQSSFLVSEGPTAGIEIDQTAPAVQAFVNELINGIWCNTFGHKIAKLRTAFLQIRTT